MDIAYVCREGDSNEELRYSLRSLRNLPHGRVYIFGGCPEFVNKQEVTHVHVPQSEYNHKDAWKTKYENVRNLIDEMASFPWLSPEFYLFNDDFFITAPVEKVPPLYLGNETEMLLHFRQRMAVPSKYVLAEQATLQWCERMGVKNPLSYALHLPLPVDKEIMGNVLDAAPWEINGHPLHIRSAYGNLAGIGGERSADVKVDRALRTGITRLNGVRIGGPTPPLTRRPKPFASSNDRSFAYADIGKWVRELFPDPSPYEN